jgi:hypothetical protein
MSLRARVECLERGRCRESFDHDAVRPGGVLRAAPEQQTIGIESDFEAVALEVRQSLRNVVSEGGAAQREKDLRGQRQHQPGSAWRTGKP